MFGRYKTKPKENKIPPSKMRKRYHNYAMYMPNVINVLWNKHSPFYDEEQTKSLPEV